MSIKIKKINPDKICWKSNRRYRYENLFTILRELKMWEAVEVTLDNPNLVLSTTLGQSFRKARAKYHLQCKKIDKEGFVWAIRKIKRMMTKWQKGAKIIEGKAKRKEVIGWMNVGSLRVLRFSKPIRYEMSKRQKDSIEILRYPRIYNMLPFSLQNRKKPLLYRKVKIIIEEL